MQANWPALPIEGKRSRKDMSQDTTPVPRPPLLNLVTYSDDDEPVSEPEVVNIVDEDDSDATTVLVDPDRREDGLEPTQVVEDTPDLELAWTRITNEQPSRQFLREFDNLLVDRQERLEMLVAQERRNAESIGITEDVDDRLLAMERLVEQRRKLATLIEQMHDGGLGNASLIVMDTQLDAPPNQMDNPIARIYGKYRARFDRDANGRIQFYVDVPPAGIFEMPRVWAFLIIDAVDEIEYDEYEWIDIFDQQRNELRVGQRVPIRTYYTDPIFRDLRGPSLDDLPHAYDDAVFMASSLDNSPTTIYLKTPRLM